MSGERKKQLAGQREELAGQREELAQSSLEHVCSRTFAFDHVELFRRH